MALQTKSAKTNKCPQWLQHNFKSLDMKLEIQPKYDGHIFVEPPSVFNEIMANPGAKKFVIKDVLDGKGGTIKLPKEHWKYKYPDGTYIYDVMNEDYDCQVRFAVEPAFPKGHTSILTDAQRQIGGALDDYGFIKMRSPKTKDIVKYAGTFEIENHKVVAFDAVSGHYKPQKIPKQRELVQKHLFAGAKASGRYIGARQVYQNMLYSDYDEQNQGGTYLADYSPINEGYGEYNGYDGYHGYQGHDYGYHGYQGHDGHVGYGDYGNFELNVMMVTIVMFGLILFCGLLSFIISAIFSFLCVSKLQSTSTIKKSDNDQEILV